MAVCVRLFATLLLLGFVGSSVSQDCTAPADEGIKRCNFDDYVSSLASAEGLHVLCVTTDSVTPNHYHLEGYTDAFFENRVVADIAAANYDEFRERIEQIVGIPEERRDAVNTYESDFMSLQPWGVFDWEGLRLNNLEGIIESQLIIVCEGGQFIWPGVRPGFRRQIRHVFGKPDGLSLETISLRPLVISIENFLDDGECERIRAESEVYMAPSPVAHKDGDVGKPATEWRTSTQHWLGSKGHPWLEAVDKRVEGLTRVPTSHQEHLQVLRYNRGEKYDAHHDFFDVDHYRTNPDIQRMLHYGTNNRMATVFWYITDVKEGGSTWFPKGNGFGHPGDAGAARGYDSCEPDVGLHSYPKKGKVIIFYSLLPSGETDDLSLHAGCPPIGDDAKWSGNKWVWNKPQGYESM